MVKYSPRGEGRASVAEVGRHVYHLAANQRKFVHSPLWKLRFLAHSCESHTHTHKHTCCNTAAKAAMQHSSIKIDLRLRKKKRMHCNFDIPLQPAALIRESITYALRALSRSHKTFSSFRLSKLIALIAFTLRLPIGPPIGCRNHRHRVAN